MGAPFKTKTNVQWLTDKDGNVLGYQNELGVFRNIPSIENSSSGKATGLTDSNGNTLVSINGYQQTYKLATYGDSRANVGGTHDGASPSATVLSADKLANTLCQLRPDIAIKFNGGVSGDVTSNWAAARGTNQALSFVFASNPDAVLIQYGINDIIGWNTSSPNFATFLASTREQLKSTCAAFMGANIFVIFESINPCAPASISFINGYSSAGGFGANYDVKLQMLQAINMAMQEWISYYPDRMVYVDTSSVTAGSDGYAKTDGTYQDGTHLSGYGNLKIAALIDAAIRYKMPVRSNVGVQSSYRNAMEGYWTNPVAGLGENIVVTPDLGTWATETYSIEGNKQIINLQCTELVSGAARRLIEFTPLIVGVSAKVPVAAGDIFQSRILYTVDDGFAGDPNIYGISMRPRLFYDDATNEYAAHGQPNATASTNYPKMPAHSGGLRSPGLAIKAGKSNANLLTTSKVQILLYANTIGTTRIALSNGQFRKVN